MKRIISLVLSLVLLVMALPLSFGASALDIATGEVEGLTYVLGDQLYFTNFDEMEIGKLPDGWEMSNSTSFGWHPDGVEAYASVEYHTAGSGNVLKYGADGTDTFISMPEIKTRNYVYEATVLTAGDCDSGSFGFANGMYGGISSAKGASFCSIPLTYSPTSVTNAYYRRKGDPTVDRQYFALADGEKNVKGATVWFKVVSIEGINYFYLGHKENGDKVYRYIGAFSQGESDNTSDWLGFYCYKGDFLVTQVEVTEIITPKQNFNNVSVYATNDDAGLNVDISFDKSNKVYKNAITGKYSYTEDAPIKFGMVYAVSDSNALNNITVQTPGAIDVLFTENLETYEKLYFNHKIENITAENLDKFYEIRPYVIINSQYCYGESRSYSPARLANNIYGMSDDETKAAISSAFKDSTVFKGENKNSLTFTLFSDFHYKENMYTVSIADLRSILKRAEDTDSAFIMSGGDFCNDFAGSPELTNTYLNYTKADGTLLTAYNIYGNHELETEGNSMENVTPTLTNDQNVIWGTEDGSFDSNIGYYYFENNGFRIVCTDTNYSLNSSSEWEHNLPATYGATKGNTKANSLGPTQLAWLEEVLTDAANKGIPCIVMSHDGFSGKFATSSSDAANVREIYARVNAIKAGTVIMSINGHHHTNHQGYNDGVFYFDMNTTRNGWWKQMTAGSKHYSSDHTYMYEEYDDEGNLIDTYEKPINDLYQSQNTWFFADPVSAVVTVDEFGTITIDGTESSWMYDVAPDTSASGVEPCVTSGTFWDGGSLSHVWTEEWDGNETHHWHTCANKTCFATDVSLNYGYETHTFEEIKKDEFLVDGETEVYYKSCFCGKLSSETFGGEEETTNPETIKVWDGSVADSYGGGSGTSDDPYLIENGAQLAKLVNDTATEGNYYKITSDIYLNDTSSDNWTQTARNWVVGTVSFYGVLDGDNHTISGLYYSGANSYVGLFSRIRGTSVAVKNLTVTQSSVTTTGDGAAAISGFIYGGTKVVFEKCILTDSVIVEGNEGAGGFVSYGTCNSVTFKSCASFASTTATYRRHGSFIGNVFYSTDTSTNPRIMSYDNCIAGDVYSDYFAAKTGSAFVNSYCAVSGTGANGTPIDDSYIPVVSLENMKGENAPNNMPLLDWENTWMADPYGSYPIYKSAFVCKEHIYGDWTTEFEATVYDKGVKIHTCTICGNTETKETAKLSCNTSGIKLLGATRITFAETDNIQYSIDGENWYNTNTVIGLESNTEYDVFVRRINPVTGKYSGVSEALVVTTIDKNCIPRALNATELSELRNWMTDDGSGCQLWRDINGDSLFDARDIVKGKKLAAGLYNNYAGGDINEDGTVNEIDFGLLSAYLDGSIENISVYNADINGDGLIDEYDLELMK